ncbi:MAG: hypothetical protein QFF03_06405 [Pseudomonadota bacterium]|nr:hypothetical protein [Pseudomonadota bacterium]
MDAQLLTQGLASSAISLPATADIIAVQQFSLDETRARARHLLAAIAMQTEDECMSDRGDWVPGDEQTVVQLAQGARAVLHHASGAIEYASALAPLEAMFKQVDEKEALIRLVQEKAKKLNLAEWAGDQGSIAFERLFQMKAQGADKSGKTSQVALSRVVGAFRHSVGGIPVLGAASLALRLAGNGAVDALSVQVRPATAERIDTAKIIAQELAAQQLVQQLVSLLGAGREQLPGDAIESAVLYFGYLDLGKRKAQQLLAPAFVAQVVLRHKLEKQAYVLAVPATEKTYQPIFSRGDDGLATGARGRC